VIDPCDLRGVSTREFLSTVERLGQVLSRKTNTRPLDSDHRPTSDVHPFCDFCRRAGRTCSIWKGEKPTASTSLSMYTPMMSASVAAASAALLWTIFDAPTLYEDDLQSRSAMTFVWFLSDDLINFVQDPAIASPSVAGALAATSMASSKLGVFEPLTEWLRMGVVRATGAIGFGMLPQMRLVSRALHVCNVLLAALLVPAFLQSRPRGTSVLPHICGFAAASVVGSMAERVEVISWPSANGYLLGTCLALLMCHAHVALGGATWVLYPRVYRWLLCGLLTAAAALSKAACITVFVAPALLDAGTWLLVTDGAPITTRDRPKKPQRPVERPAEHTGLLVLLGRLMLEQSLALSSGVAVASLATQASALDQRRALQPEQQLSASQRGLRALAMLGQVSQRRLPLIATPRIAIDCH